MILRRFIVEETGCASYLFGCPTGGEVGVVDPHLDLVGDYVAGAERAGCSIAQVFDTHVHADHRSGAVALAELTGARLRLPEGAPVEFDFEPLHHGEVVVMGNTAVEVLDTPGHAFAHSCLVVTDRRRGPDPWVVFTGDTLFVGDVGRPDLHGEEERLATALERSIRERLMSLPDWVELLPGHIGGSACGAGISSNPSSTIGFERRNNPALLAEDLGSYVLGRLEPPPSEFARIYELNRRGKTRSDNFHESEAA